MRWYPWLRAPFEQLIKQYQAGKGHHALLIHALPELGDDALIYALCRWLMCQNPNGSKSCGVCHSCQLMQAGNHPDYYSLSLEKGKNSLGIDSVRNIIEKLYGHAQLGGNKVVCLMDTDKLTEPAANALLKTLEEPPSHTWFFLSCRDQMQLPATLRSRCLYWYLSPPDDNVAIRWLNREVSSSETQLVTALRLNNGSPPAALTMLTSERWQQREAFCASLDKAYQSKDMLTLLTALNSENTPEMIHWLCSLLLDAAKYQQGSMNMITNQDKYSLIQIVAAQTPSLLLDRLLYDWSRRRSTLLQVTGVNRELLITEALLNWERLIQSKVPYLSHTI